MNMLFAPVPFRFTKLQSRSLCRANPTGEKGGAKPGKVPSYIENLPPGETTTLADIEGPGTYG
jgi:hypothetical protein